MNTWETLVASALVGIDRQSPSINFTDPALHDYKESLQSQSATQQILGAAGLIVAYQTVGQGAAKASLSLPAAANSAKLTCCSPQTTQHLSTILQENRYAKILPELLQLLAQAQQTVPPAFLPLLLDVGKRDKELRPLILPILGDLGQWLVRQNCQWEYGLGAKIADVDLANLQEIWATGSRSERLAALSQWRELQPAESREALAASWKQEKADDRVAWLEVLQTDLSLADEEFLEVALVDRSESVRFQAAHLLNQLPGQYRQRLTKLADQCLTIRESGNKYKIEVNFPETGDKKWQQFGVDYKSTGNVTVKGGMTAPKWQLLQVISAADLNVWQGDIDRLIDAVLSLQENHNILVLTGLIKAACYQKRTDWIESLLTQAHSILKDYHVRPLFQSLPAYSNFWSQFCTKLLTVDNFSNNSYQAWVMMINHNDARDWSFQISTLVVQQFHRYVQRPDPEISYYQLQHHSDILGRLLDISVLKDLQQIQATLSLDNFSYDTCIKLLEFRRDMQSLFNTT